MGGGLERLRRLGGENEDDGYVDHVGNNDGGGGITLMVMIVLK